MKFFVALIFCKILIASCYEDSCLTKSGQIGICKPLIYCPALVQDITDAKSCSGLGMYCCPVHSPPKDTKLAESCQKIMQSSHQIGVNNLIEHPYMAQILFHKKGFVGTGVLLSSKFVLTAAHIVYVRRSLPLVRLGKSTLDVQDGLQSIEVNVEQVIPHELYLPRETYFDIALLLLEESVEFNHLIFPVCLHNPQIELENEKFRQIGWTGIDDPLTVKEVQIVPNPTCETFYDEAIYKIKLPDGISDNLFCAKNDGCQAELNNDGPIEITVNSSIFIYGFATKTNCDSKSPAIYSKISSMSDWLEAIISSE